LARSYAVSFVIGDSAYVGTGLNYDSGKLADFWKYDPSSDVWSKKSSLPGNARCQAVAFALDGKGYVGTGIDSAGNYLSDFYQFDPTIGSKGKWTYVADFPDARIGSIAFVVKGKAFVGAGRISGGSVKDLWQYDQIKNTWVQQISIYGSKRENAFVMVINDIAYVGSGLDYGSYVKDFYKFDITQNGGQGAWLALNGLTGKNADGKSIIQPSPRKFGATFTIGNSGYLTCGTSSIAEEGDTWQYDPDTDTWVQYYSFTKNTPVAGSIREGAVSFTLTTSTGEYGYLVTGQYSPFVQLKDFWKFDPLGVEPNNK
jgi:N-acetylneuraminic acid mutarotase